MRGVKGVAVGELEIKWSEILPRHLLSQLSLIRPPVYKEVKYERMKGEQNQKRREEMMRREERR